MSTIFINNKKYKVNKKHNLLQVCLELGFDIPYFCWHPSLGSIGSCRQCLIKKYENFNDIKGKTIISCMTSVSDGIILDTKDINVNKYKKKIIEFMMTNHPHDCPVCEEGGNCHLQDMTVINNHYNRNYRFKKKIYKNQYLGPFIKHEMNRCITCYRCVRFYKDYSDGKDFGVYGISNNIYFGRFKSGILKSVFSGNLIEICPTGVFTDKINSKNYVRKWDMQFSPSICQQCCIGCNITLGEKFGKINKVENRYNYNINNHFICDLGRFGYQYVNLKNRPQNPIERCKNKIFILNTKQAIKKIVNIIKKSNKIIGIGSPRTSIENNFALKELVGYKNFSTGIPKKEQNNIKLILKIINKCNIHIPTLNEIEKYDAILILGEDITQTAARMALSIRQASKNNFFKIAKNNNIPYWDINSILNISKRKRCPIFITNIDYTDLKDIAFWNYNASIEDQAILGFSIANNINNNLPKVKNIKNKLQKKINLISKFLMNSKKPLIISGTHSGSSEIIKSAYNVAYALKINKKNVGMVFIFSASNTVGVSLIKGISLENAFKKIRYNNIDTLIIMENNIYRYLSKKYVNNSFKKIKNIIYIDHQKNEIYKKSNLVLPSTNFAESNGTLVNYEGRAQRFFKTFNPNLYNKNSNKLESWDWINKIRLKLNKNSINWSTFDNIVNHCINKIPQLLPMKLISPNSNFRISGKKISRSPFRLSGRSSMYNNINIHEYSITEDKDTMFNFSTEGYNNHNFHSYYNIPFMWFPKWNSLNSINKYKSSIVKDKLNKNNLGMCFFKSDESEDTNLFKVIPKLFNKKSFKILPFYLLFGSEELTQNLILFKEQMIKSIHIIFNTYDANNIDLQNGDIIKFDCENQTYSFPVFCSNTFTKRRVGLPLGIPKIPFYLLNKYISNIRKVEK
ncbi:NADH-quinone oxidoreductase subunit G [Candidatus Annandia adelgestsuga]|uniref:NADH-quinone oxidoreductase n=1 Tax=Candidatus Annandia adelgestsuga TaxID=1302411 RepID=A0A3Q9CKV4_9ENTR|nr:NADH-quinone oxidoreductase subunit NuoG [Candidatus Annandia adelgestsuga]AZP36325.1 NADH-quinone oxidoreductase subunit G [Candidatus Annandia adelgestsuga]